MKKIERSKKFYWDGPNKTFHTQNAAQRQAEFMEKQMKEYWGELCVSSRIIPGRNFYQVEVTLK